MTTPTFKAFGPLVAIVSQFPDGAGLDAIKSAYKPETNKRTLQRRLKVLAENGVITVTGRARATLYRITDSTPPGEEREGASTTIPISKEGLRIQKKVTARITSRKPIGYNRNFLETYRPNISSYLSTDEMDKLSEIGNRQNNNPAGTFAQHILNRLLIDLSWNSSRLEGNTYSLLDTERLIDQGVADDSKSVMEAQMILNHKDAIEFIVQEAGEIGFNRYTLLNIHAMLANLLLADPQAPGRLRNMAVGISGSVYTPLAMPQLISEFFDLILEVGEQIENPFEQSFFMMVHLPYLQPFDDVNKRVSRLVTNISLVKRNLSPLSFIDVPEDLYTQGMLGIYEHNDISLLKDVFMWAYERSALRYSVIRQSLGEPDPFRLKYRNQMKDLISGIIKNGMSSKVASESIQAWLLKIEKVDRKQFVEAVETEILSIHEGNFARYKVSPNEFKHWKSNW